MTKPMHSIDDEVVRSQADAFAGAMLIASADSEGEFVTGDDGIVVYWPTRGNRGAYSAWVLRLLADELDRRNVKPEAHLARALTSNGGAGK